MCKQFLKPNALKVGVFIVLIIVFYFGLHLGNVKFIPCQTRAVIPNPLPFQDSFCQLTFPFRFIVGAEIQYTWLSYLVLFIVFIVIPYLIACLIAKGLKR